MNSIIQSCEALKTSSKVAIMMYDNKKIMVKKTYTELYEISEKIDKIIASNIQSTHTNLTCIGLFMDHSVYLPSVILSLQKSKYSFVFLSLKNINETTRNLNLRWILTFAPIDIEGCTKIDEVEIEKNTTLAVCRVDNEEDASNTFTNIFCVVNTSGTTGKNKTIRITHSCIEQNAISLGKIFDIHSDDIIFWGTPLSFDPSLIELLLCLLNGASLVVVPHKICLTPQPLFHVLFNIACVTFLQMVPSVFLRWNENTVEKILCNSSLKILAFGGETFPKVILKYNRQSDLKLFNLYGVSELSCWATFHLIGKETMEDNIPIGKCLPETIIKICDEKAVEINEGIGEIHIGSNTRHCYVDDETQNSNGPTFRPTGDLVLVKDQNIYYKGRTNKIIKRFGHKVNLFKIEEAIFNECGLVSKCVWSQKCNKLLTFILIKENHTKYVNDRILDKLRNKLIHTVSEDSFPDYFEILQAFPVTSHGKIDERRLEAFYNMRMDETDCDILSLFTNLWCKYLGLNTNSMNYLNSCSFFELGGNSIHAMQLIGELKEITNIDNMDELVAAILNKKFLDCRNLVSDITKNSALYKKSNVNSIVTMNKKLKLEYGQMKIAWKYDLKACIDGSPLIFSSDNKVLIAVGSFCNIFAVLDEYGTEIYKEVLGGSIESTPAVSACSKYLYIGCYDGTMHCIDFSKNRKLWEFKAKDRIKSSPIICTDGMSVIFGSYDSHIYSLSSTDGNLLWKTNLNGSISSNLVVDDLHRIYATTIRGYCYCISETNGEIKWIYNSGSPIFGTACILFKYRQILVPSVLGVILCLSLRNGELLWKLQVDGNIFSSISNREEIIIFGCHDKNIYLLEISPSGYNYVKKCPVNSEISSTPCIHRENNRTVIISASNDGTVHVIDFDTLSVLKEIILPGEVYSSPVAYNNKILVGCRDNNLYCLLH